MNLLSSTAPPAVIHPLFICRNVLVSKNPATGGLEVPFFEFPHNFITDGTVVLGIQGRGTSKYRIFSRRVQNSGSVGARMKTELKMSLPKKLCFTFHSVVYYSLTPSYVPMMLLLIYITRLYVLFI